MRNISYTVIILMLNVIFTHSIKGQGLELRGNINTSSLVSTEERVPFWLWANQLGQIPHTDDFIQSGEINVIPKYIFRNGNKIFAGAHLYGYTGSSEELDFSELYAGVKLGKISGWAGFRADSLLQSGLSSSNGNLLNSRNARPYPRISAGTDGFIRVGKGHFYIASRWEEGFLPDERIIDKPRLHHKNLFLQWGRAEKFQFTFGIGHYAFWGGVSAESGPQPVSFSDYIRTIFAIKGGERATYSDQINAAGNSLGQYFFIFRKNWENVEAEARIIHPFEDKAGMLMCNTPDNLYSLYFTFRGKMLVQHVLMEFIYTENQGHNDRFDGVSLYFNHNFYNSGFTYFGRVIGVPFFSPVITNEDGIVTIIANDRIKAFHFGSDGNLAGNLKWKLLLSYSLNYGTYLSEYDNVRKQFSGLAGFEYTLPKIPVFLRTSIALDQGVNLNYGEERFDGGVRLTIGGYLN